MRRCFLQAPGPSSQDISSDLSGQFAVDFKVLVNAHGHRAAEWRAK